MLVYDCNNWNHVKGKYLTNETDCSECSPHKMSMNCALPRQGNAVELFQSGPSTCVWPVIAKKPFSFYSKRWLVVLNIRSFWSPEIIKKFGLFFLILYSWLLFEFIVCARLCNLGGRYWLDFHVPQVHCDMHGTRSSYTLMPIGSRWHALLWVSFA